MNQRGQALIEFALIFSLIVLVCIVALQTTGTDVRPLISHVANDV